jgi:hypothetical protein
MSYIKNEVKQILATEVMGFLEWKLIKQVPTEQLLCQLLISYNIEIADSEQRLTVSLFDYLTANNGLCLLIII